MEIPQKEKAAALERAVINSSAGELSRIYDGLGEVEMPAPALGLACRFRGPDVVRVLIQKGATFDFPSKRRIEETYGCYFGRKCGNYRTNYSLYLLKVFEEDLRGAYCFKGMALGQSAERETGEALEFLADDERVKVLRCLLENREKISFQPEEMLFYAIYFGDTVIVEELKRCGIRISEVRVRTLTDDTVALDAYWLEYIAMTERLDDAEYVTVMQLLAAELDGKQFRFTENLYEVMKRHFYDVRVFEFFLANFKQEKMKKYQIIRGLIEIDAAEVLPVVERENWITTPKKRDEMIAYASENGKTESLAWLLDYKNRTADFATEQEKAEKKMMRELNIAPDSVAAFKRIWSYRKREDGTLLITNYKGTDTEVTVPEKIGKGIVTGIGKGAFAGDYSNPKVTDEQTAQHNRITKIILPETLQYIGEYAFSGMQALKEISIPKGVREISKYAFETCISLKQITIPGTVKKIGKHAFSYCRKLEKVCICEGVFEIDECVFWDCDNLQEVRLPKSVQRLNTGMIGISKYEIFDDCPKVIVYCPKGSKAEEYCREKRVRFKNSDV